MTSSSRPVLFSSLLALAACLGPVLMPMPLGAQVSGEASSRSSSAKGEAEAVSRPLMRDFMGLNGHFTFKPELYSATCRLARNYHPLGWDVPREDVSELPVFPLARNKVNWDEHVYGNWKRFGFEVDACLMFGEGESAPVVEVWAAKPDAAFAYGKRFAEFFGPSSEGRFVTSAEIGNEPGQRVPDAAYKKVFEAMARGLRAGDPKLKIVTCTATALEADDYSKSLDVFRGMEDLYDVVNVHQYAQVEGWPTWRRSFPEDRSIRYLDVVEAAIDWRDRHAPGKEVWLTEFGYDSVTADAMKKRVKPFERWQGVSDEQQAQWIVRSFLLFSALDLDRAYLYFYNDEDKAAVHAGAGLTRHFKPKPSFHAMAHLYRSLGAYRFEEALVTQEKGLHLHAYASETGERVWVAWLGSGESTRRTLSLPLDEKVEVLRAERMPLIAGEVESVEVQNSSGGLALELGSSPVYLWLR